MVVTRGARVGLLVLALAAAGAPLLLRREPARPNIVLVVLDTLRADSLGCYGSPHTVTPHLDRIAAGGLRFERAVAQAPWTVPSLASLLTGLYPSEHGQGAQRSSRRARRVRTLAARLAARGYQTAAFSEVGFPLLKRGFRTFEMPAGDGDERLAHPERDGAELTFSRGLAWLRTRDPRPFFLLLHTYEVHDYFMAKPYQRDLAQRTNPSYRAPFLQWAIRDKREPVGERLIEDLLAADAQDIAFVHGLYLAAVAAADRAVGRLDATLAELGLASETVLVVVSDHGEGFAPQLRRVSHGGRLHDDLLRVPLLVRWPGRIPAGVVAVRIETLDLLPTLLSLARAGNAPPVSGRGLLEAEGGWRRLLGMERFVPVRGPERQAFAEESALFVDETGRRRTSSVHQFALYSRGAKLIRRGESVELYDLEADALEQRNLAVPHPQLAAAMGEQLARRVRDLALPVAAAHDPETLDVLRSLGYVR